MIKPQVIIVGAGAAGLAAARVLSQAGCSVLIIEGRSRVGGRIWTIHDRAFGLPVELGAEFIHGRPEATWTMMRAAGLVACDVPFDHLYRRQGRLVREPPFTHEVNKVMTGLARSGRPDISFSDYLRRHRTGSQAQSQRLAKGFVEGFDAADPERISVRSLAREHEGLGDLEAEPQFRLLDGYGSLIDFLRQSLDPERITIRLRTAVSEIHWKRFKVQVCCGRGCRTQFEAARVIITLPLGILQLAPGTPGSIRFAPEIVDKHQAAQQLASGPVVKMVLRFHESFWEKKAVARTAQAGEQLRNAAFLHDFDLPFPTWWTPRPLRVPVLTGWAGGPKAVTLSGLSQGAVVENAIDALSELFGQRKTRLRAWLDRCYFHDWPADPLARGAYSYVTVGGMKARAALARPIESTLFFAGEATDTHGQASTVAGALSSGQRAAEEVLATL